MLAPETERDIFDFRMCNFVGSLGISSAAAISSRAICKLIACSKEKNAGFAAANERRRQLGEAWKTVSAEEKARYLVASCAFPLLCDEVFAALLPPAQSQSSPLSLGPSRFSRVCSLRAIRNSCASGSTAHVRAPEAGPLRGRLLLPLGRPVGGEGGATCPSEYECEYHVEWRLFQLV